LVSFVYRQVFNYYSYGYGAALSIVIFVILLLFSINFIRRTRATEGVY
jgi:arabinogalactan oligomer/maltooligosaccharide transport system permease protein